VFAHWSCDHCGRSHHLTVGLALLYHPALVSFFHDHGVDLTSVNHWELESVTSDNLTTVRSRDPWEVELAVSLEGETLELAVDESLELLETDRSRE